MVELYLNNQLCDLYGNEEIATSYSIAPIADISKRTGSRSISFNIPRTANNLAILESIQVIVNSSTVPYSLIPARLYENGLTQNIYFAEVGSVKDDIEVRLYGTNQDFFSLLKDKKLRSLDLGQYDHAWTVANAAASVNNVEGYIYGFIDFFTDSPNAFLANTQSIDLRYLYPSVLLSTLVIEIIAQSGYTIESNFSNDDFNRIIIPCLSKKASSIDTDGLAEATASTGGTVFVDFDTEVSDVLGLFARELFQIHVLGTTFSEQIYRYKVLANGNYDIEVNITVTLGANTEVYLLRQKDDGSPTEILDVASSSGSHVLSVSDYPLLKNDRIFVMLIGLGSGTYNAGASFEVTKITLENPDNDEDISIGNTFRMAYNLPDMKQSDLLKMVAQKFCWIIDANPITKVVTIRTFDEIVNNIPNAKDWSDKVDYSEKPEITFKSDYAQLNNMKYKDDDSVVKPAGTDYFFRINNTNLEAEKDVIESKFAASIQVERLNGYSIAHIPLIEAAGTDQEQTMNVEPRILSVYFPEPHTSPPHITITDGTLSQNVVTLPMTKFIIQGDDFNLGFKDNLFTFSESLIEVLQDFKVVKMLLRLNAADINQLDFFTPVWIEIKGQPGCYYYISEISQFKIGSSESTEVELVKL